jgi:hypothetical protein
VTTHANIMLRSTPIAGVPGQLTHFQRITLCIFKREDFSFITNLRKLLILKPVKCLSADETVT